MSAAFSPNQIKKTLKVKSKSYTISSFEKFNKLKLGSAERLPFSIKVLLESALRNFDNYQVTLKDVKNILSWSPTDKTPKDIAF